jgi:hypothetical protein
MFTVALQGFPATTQLRNKTSSVVDQDTDPDPAFIVNPDTDPDPIRMQGFED